MPPSWRHSPPRAATPTFDLGVVDAVARPLSDPGQEDLGRGTGIETTLEELEGYQVVKAIACSEVKPQRIAQRDSKSYFAILLDDNNRKPIARLHFNAKSKKYLGTFDADKNETRHPLDSIDEIYLHADKIREAVRGYLD